MMDTKKVKQIADTEAKKMVKGHESRMHAKHAARTPSRCVFLL